MSDRLPVVSGEKFIKFLKSRGYIQDRQKGSHVIMVNETEDVEITVPLHKELKRGLIIKLIKTAKIKRDEFIRAMRVH